MGVDEGKRGVSRRAQPASETKPTDGARALDRRYRIAYAAWCYLEKPVAGLSWAEIAFLTAIPQSRMNPSTADGRRAARERGRRILDALLDEGVLGAEEHELAIRQLARLSLQRPGAAFPVRSRRPEAAMHALLRLSDRVRSDSPHWNVHVEYVVETTLDLDLQEEVTRTAWSAILECHEWKSEGASNGAVIVVDIQTSEVLAW